MGLFDFFNNKLKRADKNSVSDKEVLKVNLDNIQKEIHLFLKPLGYKKKGRTFNRQVEEGLYQVINIQSGRYEFGDKYVIPGIRENYYGKFTINLGIMVREIYDLDSYHKPKDFFQEYECQIRQRLSHLTVEKDFWWTISDDTEKTTKEIFEGLNTYGFEWFDTFSTREKIINNWGLKADSNSPRAKLDVALIVFHRDKDKGKMLIQDYYDNIENNKPHKKYVKELADKLGVSLGI